MSTSIYSMIISDSVTDIRNTGRPYHWQARPIPLQALRLLPAPVLVLPRRLVIRRGSVTTVLKMRRRLRLSKEKRKDSAAGLGRGNDENKIRMMHLVCKSILNIYQYLRAPLQIVPVARVVNSASLRTLSRCRSP